MINNHRSRYTQMFEGKTVNIFFLILTYAVGVKKTHVIEMVLLSVQSIYFVQKKKYIFFSLITHSYPEA